MVEGETIFRIMAAMVPVLSLALGYQFQVIRAIQKQVDNCIDHLADRAKKE